jgi:hypothetical protein
MRVAIIQSNYIPWKGYFDIIHDVDLFIFYDDVQYTRGDWRNRNKIKTARGTEWLTIPNNGNLDHLIYQVELIDPRWQSKHWKTLCQVYGKAPFFGTYRSTLEDIYLGQGWNYLSELNQYLIKWIAIDILKIKTKFSDSRQFHSTGTKQGRVIDLLTKTNASVYVSGPSAKNYIDEDQFRNSGIGLIWKDYNGFPPYPQFHPPFEHGVTILDLLFHTGPDAPWYIWGWRNEETRGLHATN